MAEQQLKPVRMEGVRLVFRNFEGRPGPFNREGVRNFGIVLPPDIAEAMERDGWNVKYLKPSEEDQEEGIEQGPPWLPVEAAFHKGRPPKIMLVTSQHPEGTRLNDDTVEQLDGVDIKIGDDGLPMVDVLVNPRQWGPNAEGKSGIKAYLKTMYITIEEDELDLKYAQRAAPQSE